MQNYQYEHELELSKFPKEHTVNMAINNNDVIKYGVVPFNAKRLQIFMYNYMRQIPDKVAITNYGINGYPSISILQYDGNKIIYTVRDIINDRVEYNTFYGYNIYEKYRKKRNRLLRDYNLITFNNHEFTVFSELISLI